MKLTDAQASLLAKSLKYNITREIDDFTKVDFKTDVDMLVQKIKFAYYHSKTASNKQNPVVNNQIDTPLVKNK